MEALSLVIRHVCENEADYARFPGRGHGSVISGLINNYGGIMPLHQAVLQSNFEAVMQLVEAGADVNAQDRTRLTPLQYCNAPGAIADYLLSQGATPTLPPSSTWLHYLGRSVKTQRETATQILRMTSYHSINESFSLTPELHPKALIAIMNSGQDLNVKDEGNSSIMFVSMCSPDTATLVLNDSIQLTGTDPCPWYMLGRPIETASCINQHWKYYLRRFGMNEFRRVSNLQPNRGWSPLCLATCTDAIEVMEHCFEMGAEVDFEGSPYGSALMAAAAMNRIESVKFLVRRNASIFYTGKHGFTSAVMAEVTPQRVVEWLLVKGFQDQGKLEETSDSHGAAEDSSDVRARLSWCPIRIQLRLNADFERQPHESLFAYLRRLAIIKKQMRGRIVPVPKPEFIARSKISVIYDI
ncbi:hypothetical protein KJ359_009778 [Pestalotiopsis sp. 9143b]|nr:hypothetical protein KJ359_009778 [Pestalotiopsis sp. 9143b]